MTVSLPAPPPFKIIADLPLTFIFPSSLFIGAAGLALLVKARVFVVNVCSPYCCSVLLAVLIVVAVTSPPS
ncbi:hypothetical protein PIB30_054340 [Stylosanthes scabra]|uniref:Uncharacterized protein n=1 Tax=Stylosanthes scabra TaxID=79078 RepID=A0ABU6WKE5_9FABA|nr:hypothetical protein [Stylosanthes scabra]